MNRTSTGILLLLFVLSPAAKAQNNARTCLKVSPAAVHDFGTITHTEKPEHVYILKNSCSDTLTIDHVKATCGCTATMLSKSVLAPGDTTSIWLKFYPPRSSNGKVHKSVSVYVNNESRPRLMLRMDADLVSHFYATPEKVALGEVGIKKKLRTIVKLHNNSDDTEEILDIVNALGIEGRDAKGAVFMSQLKDITFTPSTFILKPGESIDIVVEFTPHRIGKLMGSMIFYTKSENRQIEFNGVVVRQ